MFGGIYRRHMLGILLHTVPIYKLLNSVCLFLQLHRQIIAFHGTRYIQIHQRDNINSSTDTQAAFRHGMCARHECEHLFEVFLKNIHVQDDGWHGHQLENSAIMRLAYTFQKFSLKSAALVICYHPYTRDISQ